MTSAHTSDESELDSAYDGIEVKVGNVELALESLEIEGFVY